MLTPATTSLPGTVADHGGGRGGAARTGPDLFGGGVSSLAPLVDASAHAHAGRWRESRVGMPEDFFTMPEASFLCAAGSRGRGLADAAAAPHLPRREQGRPSAALAVASAAPAPIETPRFSGEAPAAARGDDDKCDAPRPPAQTAHHPCVDSPPRTGPPRPARACPCVRPAPLVPARALAPLPALARPRHEAPVPDLRRVYI